MDKQVLQTAEEEQESSSSTLVNSEVIMMDMNIAVENRKDIHAMASLLTKNHFFQEKFVPFMQSLKLPNSDAFQLEQQCGNTLPPIYNVLSRALSSWLGHMGSAGATFPILIQVLEDLQMTGAKNIVEDYYKAKVGNKDFEQSDVPELSRPLSDDRAMNKNFLEFVNRLRLPNSTIFAIEKEFDGVYNTGPFYNLVSRALETWKARHGREIATFQALVDALEKNGLGGAAAEIQKYFRDHVQEDDGIGNR